VNLNGSLHVDSSSLTAVSGITNLTNIGGDLTINSNGALSNVPGFSGLQTVTGNVSIQSNASLTNISGFSALTGIGGYLYIYNDTTLANLSGLTNLTSIGDYLNIYANGQLNSIFSLIKPTGKLATLGGNLTVQSNAALSSCQPDALKAGLTNWNNTYAQSSNLTCAKTCTAGVCQ